MDNINLIKKKILFRSQHRGNKEMDLLLSNFVKKYIESFNKKELSELENFLSFDDEVLLKWYLNQDIKTLMPKNKITKKFKNFKL